MYCHEGMWQKVDRIWTIRTDGTQNQLIHKRTMETEIAGHEWCGVPTAKPCSINSIFRAYGAASHRQLQRQNRRERAFWLALTLLTNRPSNTRQFIARRQTLLRAMATGIRHADFSISPGNGSGQQHGWRSISSGPAIWNRRSFPCNMSRHNYRLEPESRASRRT